jgi:hypothetical protein
MKQAFGTAALRQQNRTYAGTGGVSMGNRSHGFAPAFYDTQSHVAVISRYANGNPAPVHILDGVPAEWVVNRDEHGKVRTVKNSVIAGFIRFGRFYTREQAAATVQ